MKLFKKFRRNEDWDKKDEDDLSIYSRQVREEWLEDDELSAAEEAFMNGYEDVI